MIRHLIHYLTQCLMLPVQLCRRFFRSVIWNVAHLAESPTRLISWPFRLIAGGITGGTQLLVEWWHGRQMGYLLRGLPTLLLIILSLLMVGASNSMSGKLAEKYQIAANQAFRDEDFESAKLFYERAVGMHTLADDVMLDLMEASTKSGDTARASYILEQLAPLHHPRSARAHAEKARQLLINGTAEDRKDIETHLQHTLSLVQTGESASFARTLLGEIRFQQGRFAEAKGLLSQETLDREEFKIAPNLPDGQRLRAVQMLLGKCNARLNDESVANKYFRSALKNFLARLAMAPDDDVARISAVECQALLYDFPAGKKLIDEALLALSSRTDEESKKKIRSWKSLLASLYVGWARHLKGTSVASQEEKFHYLTRAVDNDPDNSDWFDEMSALLTRNDVIGKKAGEFVENQLALGRSEGMCHLLLGNGAFLRQDPRQAELHLEKAFELLPNAPVVANNMAWFLAMRAEAPEPERALVMIDVVLKRFPKVPRFHDTRGHIYVKLERWAEALTDLEIALPYMSDNTSTHAALAETYAQLGNASLAAKHLELARPRK